MMGEGINDGFNIHEPSAAALLNNDGSELSMQLQQTQNAAGATQVTNREGFRQMIQLTTLEAQLQQVRHENTQLTYDLNLATKELDELREDVVLSKRKIELRERYLTDKERQMAEWEHRLTNAE